MDSNGAWRTDLINRKTEAELIKSFLLGKLDQREANKQPRSFVLNLDAPWGSGKTFFLENLAIDLANNEYLVAKVNAWIDDHSDDPLTSVVAAIDSVVKRAEPSKLTKHINLDAIKRNAGKIAVTTALGIGKRFTERYLGTAVSDVIELATDSSPGNTTVTDAISEEISKNNDAAWAMLSDRMLENFKAEKAALSDFRESFQNLVAELAVSNPKHAQIFVLIDELDRCRPSYAILMLERIKHLFSTSGAVFVLATDTAQLRESIKAVYGAGFDSEKYLNRFFDRQYRLSVRTTSEFAEETLRQLGSTTKLNMPDGTRLVDYFRRCSEEFQLTLRDTEQCANMLADTVLVWKNEQKIQLAYLIPLLMIRKTNPEMLDRIERNAWRAEDTQHLSRVLGFTTTAIGPDDSRLTAWQLFKGLHDRRSWDFDTAKREADSENRSHGTVGWIGKTVYDELLVRVKSAGGDRKLKSLLSQYFEIVQSIAGLSA